MCVEVVKSMALKPTRSITGAMVSVRAVSTPSAAQRHWLPSRSEVSTSWMSAIVRTLLGVAALEESPHEPGIEPAGLKFRIRQHELVEWQIRVDTSDPRRAYGTS